MPKITNRGQKKQQNRFEPYKRGQKELPAQENSSKPSAVTAQPFDLFLPSIYAFKTHTCQHCSSHRGNHGMEKFKTGRSKHLAARKKTYGTYNPDVALFHAVPVYDDVMAEKWLHSVLKYFGFHYKKEVYTVNAGTLEAIMNYIGVACDLAIAYGRHPEQLNRIAMQMKSFRK